MMKLKTDSKRGFTLLELLIVIAILAILATAVVLVLNPAEYLKQSRDTQRMSDMSTLRDAINLYLSTVSAAALTDIEKCNVTGCAAAAGSPFGADTLVDTDTTVDGNGWVNINFSQISGGSPLAKLPLDPTNSTTYFYAYKSVAASSTFELDAKLESDKYSGNNGSDGGNNANWYEVGNTLQLQ